MLSGGCSCRLARVSLMALTVLFALDGRASWADSACKERIHAWLDGAPDARIGALRKSLRESSSPRTAADDDCLVGALARVTDPQEFNELKPDVVWASRRFLKTREPNLLAAATKLVARAGGMAEIDHEVRSTLDAGEDILREQALLLNLRQPETDSAKGSDVAILSQTLGRLDRPSARVLAMGALFEILDFRKDSTRFDLALKLLDDEDLRVVWHAADALKAWAEGVGISARPAVLDEAAQRPARRLGPAEVQEIRRWFRANAGTFRGGPVSAS